MTKFNKIINSKIFFILCVSIYAVITLVRIFNHIPFVDESHAWSLAEELSFGQMFNEVKNEGHFFIWQSLLYPFAKLHLYPYSMQLLNWTFCLIALIIMWWKAPFNNVVKGLITFSFPFLGCYGVIARCYSVGIMLLFILASMNDVKLKYPKTYVTVLILCANTSVMALMGASALGLIFLYDMFKQKSLNKKDYTFVLAILSIGAILIFYQLFNMDYFIPITSNRKLHISIKLFRNVFVYNNLFLNFLLLGVFSLPIFKYLFNNKSSLFFMSYTYLLLLLFVTTIYGGYFWHSYFFFIYLIISFWLCDKNESENISKKIAVVTFGIISFILIFHKPTPSETFFVFGDKNAKNFLEIIKNDSNLKNAQIIQNDGLLMTLKPYSARNDFVLKTYCGTERYDVSLLNGDNKLCVVERTVEQAKLNPNVIKQIIQSSSKETYTYMNLSSYKTDKTLYKIPANGYFIYFKKYKCYDKYCFWKIEIDD